MSLRRDVPRRKSRRRLDQIVLDLLFPLLSPDELRPWVRLGAAALPVLAVVVLVIVALNQPR